MEKHLPTALAEASLALPAAHRRAWLECKRLESFELQAKAELTAEGVPLTIRNVVERQYALAFPEKMKR